MNTAFLLLAQYNGASVIPADLVCRDYFQHLRPEEFARKVAKGAIDIPIVRMDPGSNKGTKCVHLQDLAAYTDVRRAESRKEFRQMNLSPSHKPDLCRLGEVYASPFELAALAIGDCELDQQWQRAQLCRKCGAPGGASPSPSTPDKPIFVDILSI